LTKIERYDFLVNKVNLFNGFYPAASMYPPRGSIEIHCPELYFDAKKMAEDLEKKLKKEITLKTTFEPPVEIDPARGCGWFGVTKHKLYKSIFFH
jgi:hypothetical protein